MNNFNKRINEIFNFGNTGSWKVIVDGEMMWDEFGGTKANAIKRFKEKYKGKKIKVVPALTKDDFK